jgi:glycosyltransferase involved in cell wall biosynthesis
MDKGNIHIVIPVYNHGEKLGEVVQNLRQEGYQNIILINDGSDNAQFPTFLPPGITYIKHRVNLGQGAALQTGFTQALKDGAGIVVSFDADGQHNASDLEILISPLLAGEADVALGSRFLTPYQDPMPPVKIILLKTARLINYLFTGMMLSDAHNGLRAMNKQAVEKIRITENRMAHATEILFEIKKYGLVVKEVPVKVKYTDYSRSHGQSPWNSIKIFFDILLYKLFA